MLYNDIKITKNPINAKMADNIFSAVIYILFTKKSTKNPAFEPKKSTDNSNNDFLG